MQIVYQQQTPFNGLSSPLGFGSTQTAAEAAEAPHDEEVPVHHVTQFNENHLLQLLSAIREIVIKRYSYSTHKTSTVRCSSTMSLRRHVATRGVVSMKARVCVLQRLL